MDAICMTIIWLLFVKAASEGNITGKTKCDQLALGGQARVTCHFGEDVMKTNEVTAVFVQRLPLPHSNKNGTIPERVVRCHRFTGNEFDCLCKDGYKQQGVISEQMIIVIPNIKPEQEGSYLCEVARKERTDQMDVCTVEIKAAVPSDSTTSSVQDNIDIQNREKAAENSKQFMVTNIVLAVICLMTLVSLSASWIYFCKIRRRHQPKPVPSKAAFEMTDTASQEREESSSKPHDNEDLYSELNENNQQLLLHYGVNFEEFAQVSAQHSVDEILQNCAEDNSCQTTAEVTSPDTKCIVHIEYATSATTLHMEERGMLGIGSSQCNDNTGNRTESVNAQVLWGIVARLQKEITVLHSLLKGNLAVDAKDFRQGL